MKNLIKLTQLLFFLLLLSSCKTLVNQKAPINNLETPEEEKGKMDKSKMEISISCGDGQISKFLDDGWIIVQEYEEEKICSWKSFPANKDCDMEKDKGCKITAPDEIGKEIFYILEKK